ncbi:hypothetical protein [Paucibacter sp. XJ19-41]|uniref:hypothetical protein n=1 Tax=Paucibacter sp. XJ19-41 TaxID=2927824 RepID=UPI00234B9B0F|nr:hypothetical protein [Paucibacter sp. XJ19-41]MDC6166581.1 hypothetical protein [Paucibacter sp. XJ19-41]
MKLRTTSAGPLTSRGDHPAPHGKQAPIAAALSAAALLLGTSTPALALDGCLVLLCLAAPSWRAIPQCVPPITQLWRDLARGRAFPNCSMAGGGNSASHAWASAPSFCPPQYTRIVDGPNGPRYYCNYTGAVAVTVNGQAFARTWWTLSGDTVTDFSPAAKAMLGRWDRRFDDDYAAWLASQPPAPPVESGN